MMRELTQSEMEQLNAFLDGELDASESSRVKAMIASDAAWAQADLELQSLDDLLGERGGVRGIGRIRLEELRPFLTVGPGGTAPQAMRP